MSAATTSSSWEDISIAPFGRDLELAVIEGGSLHALVFACRRASGQRPTPLLALNSERVCRRGGGKLLTLKDAADYITKLPKAEQHDPAWQAAVEALILVAETDGPTMCVDQRANQPSRHREPDALASYGR